MSCETALKLNAIENTGNLASGNTHLVVQASSIAFTERQVSNPLPPAGCCLPNNYLPVSPYSGGNSSSGLQQALQRQAQLCDAQQNLAVAKLQQTNSTTQACTTPGNLSRFSPAVRFQQYTRRPVPIPCPPIVSNAGVPKATDGPCTNVINFIQTWPPH